MARKPASSGDGPGLFGDLAPRPLADRLRPKSLDEVVGQDHLLGPEGPLRRMVDQGRLTSVILWGGPGCGKTTIARLLADFTDLAFEPLSAVFSGVADLRQVFERARERRVGGGGAPRGRCAAPRALGRARSAPSAPTRPFGKVW